MKVQMLVQNDGLVGAGAGVGVGVGVGSGFTTGPTGNGAGAGVGAGAAEGSEVRSIPVMLTEACTLPSLAPLMVLVK